MNSIHEEISVIHEERQSDIQREKWNDEKQIDNLSAEEIEEFFQAIEDGSLERLERLFDQKLHANPNMTLFTESLLMAAIRNEQNDIADYLIDQLAIDVQHTADFHEFELRSQIPIRYRKCSCRDLAYEKDMMELVDLIDITNPNVTTNIKLYLKNRLKTRLNHIHQAYLKRTDDSNKHILFENNHEKDNSSQYPTVNRIDEIDPKSSKIESTMLPKLTTHRPRKSFVEETLENLDTSKEKSIDETGKKTFRFSNYTLRFRLMETSKHEPKVPILPTISLFNSPSTSLITANNTFRSISETSSHLSFRESRASICRSPRQTILPPITSIESRPSIIQTRETKRSVPKARKHQSYNYGYMPRPQQQTTYNPPQRFMPVTLKSTAIGLPSDTRLIRD